MSLTYVHPDNLHSVWQVVKDGLQYIIDKTNDEWMPEDVYHFLKAGGMALYMQEGNKGFAVVQTIRGWRGPEFIVFAAYSREGHELVLQEAEQIKEMARQSGARKIKCQSNRRGMEKLAQEVGFKLDFVQWEIDLTP